MTGDFSSAVFEFLNNNTSYAVLRNFEGLPRNNRGRDIDILICKRDFELHKKSICEIISNFGYRIAILYRSDKVYAMMCVTSSGDNVHFEFLFGTSLHGVVFLMSKDVLDNRVFNGAVYHVSLEYEFLDKYLYLKSLGVEYPQKYSTVKSEVLKRNRVDSIVQGFSWFKSLSDLDSKSPRRFIWLMFLYNIRQRPIDQIKQIALNLYYNVINRFSLNGISFSCTGVDGVGKSTIIDGIIAILSQTSRVNLYHHRPTIIGNIGEVAYKTGLIKEVDKDFNKPHRAKKNGVISSILRLSYYSLDYIGGYWLKCRRQMFKREVVIFDRYFSDIIVDSRRSSIYLNTKFLYYWSKLFIPKMQYNFLITAQTDIILSRKQELNSEEIEHINAKMEYLASKKGYHLIENNGTAEQAITKILDTIIEAQHARNMKKLE
ncbi:MAG: hypothetical protein SNH13_00950 [Rikenellaceae bacterium]